MGSVIIICHKTRSIVLPGNAVTLNSEMCSSHDCECLLGSLSMFPISLLPQFTATQKLTCRKSGPINFGSWCHTPKQRNRNSGWYSTPTVQSRVFEDPFRPSQCAVVKAVAIFGSQFHWSAPVHKEAIPKVVLLLKYVVLLQQISDHAFNGKLVLETCFHSQW